MMYLAPSSSSGARFFWREANELKMTVATTNQSSAAYLHIPFYRRRCYYCDFPVYVVGDKRSGENSQMVQTYVEVICQEIIASHNYGQPLDLIDGQKS